MNKYYHVVLNKDNHYFYEIFEISHIPHSDFLSAIPVCTLYSSDEEIKERIFEFEKFGDLKITHPKNLELLEKYNEKREFYICAKDAMDIIRENYKKLANDHIKEILRMHDHIHDANAELL